MSTILGMTAIERLWLKFNENATDVSPKAHEILPSFRTVRSFDTELREYQQYKARLESMPTVMCQAANIHGLKEALGIISTWIMIGLLLFLAA
jgi:hypothetical protein